MQQFLTNIYLFPSDSDVDSDWEGGECPPGTSGQCECEQCDVMSDRTEAPRPCETAGDCQSDQYLASPCSSSPCLAGGTCEEHDGTFTCYCGPGRAGKLCEETLENFNISVPAFHGKSFIQLSGGRPGLGGLRSDLRLEFRTFLSSCLLYHSPGGSRRPGDSLSLSVREKYLELHFSLSGSSLVLRSEVPVRLGAWHSVRAGRYRSQAMLQLDDLPPVTGESQSSLATLDLAHISYLGHSPSLPLPGLQGCVRSLQLGRTMVSLGWSVSQGVTECQSHPCTGTCHQGADCVSVWPPQVSRSLCLCPPDYSGPHCQYRRGLCQPNPCHHGGVCRHRQDQPGLTCHCRPGHSGSLCHLKTRED